MDSGASSPQQSSTFTAVNASASIARHTEIQKTSITIARSMTDPQPSWAKGLESIPYSTMKLPRLRKNLGFDVKKSYYRHNAFCDNMRVFVKDAYTRTWGKDFDSHASEWRDNHTQLVKMTETFVETRSPIFWPDFDKWSQEVQKRVKRLVTQHIFMVKVMSDRSKKYKSPKRAKCKGTIEQRALATRQDHSSRAEDSESTPGLPTRACEYEVTLNRDFSMSGERAESTITSASRERNDEAPKWAMDLATLAKPDVPLIPTLDQRLQHPQRGSKKKGRISQHLREFLKQGNYEYGHTLSSWPGDLKFLARITEAFVAQKGNELWPSSSRSLRYGDDEDRIKRLVMQLCFRVLNDCTIPRDTPEHNTIIAIPDESEILCTPIMGDREMSSHDEAQDKPSITFIYRVVRETEQGYHSRAWYSEGNFFQKSFSEVKQELDVEGAKALAFTLQGQKIDATEHVLYDDERRFVSAQECFEKAVGKYRQPGESQIMIVVDVV